MTTQPVRDTKAMLSGMTPSLDAADYVFCTTKDEQLAMQAAPSSLGWFREAEGVSAILELGDAQRLGFDTTLPMRRITLNVFSSLEGVGLTAAGATALANHNISCNMVAALSSRPRLRANGGRGRGHAGAAGPAGGGWLKLERMELASGQKLAKLKTPARTSTPSLPRPKSGTEYSAMQCSLSVGNGTR